MKISELRSIFLKSLEGLYSPEEAQSFFKILSEEYLSMCRLDIALNKNRSVSENMIRQFQSAISDLKNYKPIQYIIGKTEFYGMSFKVNKHTLIPRPETEELVDWILSDENLTKKPISILDIGTGSGCIALSLANNLPGSTVHALDVSKEALDIAKENAELNNVAVHLFQTDILKATSLPSTAAGIKENYDVIVSNPPYVRELEKDLMQPNVLEYEPATALFVPDSDPLIFYSVISNLAKTHLKPGGALFFEINESLSGKLKELLTNKGFQTIEVKQDIYGKDRMVRCCL